MAAEFEDEVLTFMVKAIIVAGCAVALAPSLVSTISTGSSIAPLSNRLYLDPDTGNYWVYVPGEEQKT